MRGATPSPISLRAGHATSIHAPHAWGDSPLTELSRRTNTLQSTPHMRGATSAPIFKGFSDCTSIHAPHAWGDYLRKNIDFDRAATSIHAPHAWGDLLGGFMGKNYTDFNPRPTCVGRHPARYHLGPGTLLQSTPHMRGATFDIFSPAKATDTSIHAPHAWGDTIPIHHRIRPLITSIHAPHAWGDRNAIYLENDVKTSIHAPHAWGDTQPDIT